MAGLYDNCAVNVSAQIPRRGGILTDQVTIQWAWKAGDVSSTVFSQSFPLIYDCAHSFGKQTWRERDDPSIVALHGLLV
jgi:hypothetical protein